MVRHGISNHYPQITDNRTFFLQKFAYDNPQSFVIKA